MTTFTMIWTSSNWMGYCVYHENMLGNIQDIFFLILGVSENEWKLRESDHRLDSVESRGIPWISQCNWYVQRYMYIWLVVTGTWILWLSISYMGIIIPTDFHSIIFQRGRARPPTRYVHVCLHPFLALPIACIYPLVMTIIANWKITIFMGKSTINGYFQ